MSGFETAVVGRGSTVLNYIACSVWGGVSSTVGWIRMACAGPLTECWNAYPRALAR